MLTVEILPHEFRFTEEKRLSNSIPRVLYIIRWFPRESFAAKI